MLKSYQRNRGIQKIVANLWKGASRGVCVVKMMMAPVTPTSYLLQSGHGVVACRWPQVGEGGPWVGGHQGWAVPGVPTGTGERRFVCNVCGRSYKRRDNLSQHQHCHTGERPYVCSQCGSTFSQRWALHYHKLKGCALPN